MEYQIKVYYIWEFGQRVDSKGSPHQEDSLFPLPEHLSESDRCFVLCDGMGGHDAGEIASSTVCEAMGKSVLHLQPDSEGDFSEAMFSKAISDAFLALDEKDTGAQKKMGTTMTFLKLHKKGAFIAHMGDSRVYHIRPGKTTASTHILFKTRDHSLVNDLVAIGELTEEEAKTFNRKNVITRAMQPHLEHSPKADIYHTDNIQPGDFFYLCSDGMLENMEDPQICFNFSDEAGTDEEKVRRLINATRENRDNHTAIIIRIVEVKSSSVKQTMPLINGTQKGTQEKQSIDKVPSAKDKEYKNHENSIGTIGIEKSIESKENQSKINSNSDQLTLTVNKTAQQNDLSSENSTIKQWIIYLISLIIVLIVILVSCWINNAEG